MFFTNSLTSLSFHSVTSVCEAEYLGGRISGRMVINSVMLSSKNFPLNIGKKFKNAETKYSGRKRGKAYF
jgi:hypothetical protein